MKALLRRIDRIESRLRLRDCDIGLLTEEELDKRIAALDAEIAQWPPTDPNDLEEIELDKRIAELLAEIRGMEAPPAPEALAELKMVQTVVLAPETPPETPPEVPQVVPEPIKITGPEDQPEADPELAPLHTQEEYIERERHPPEGSVAGTFHYSQQELDHAKELMKAHLRGREYHPLVDGWND
jgi:uncharacterized small protein (DUF1192 family)